MRHGECLYASICSVHLKGVMARIGKANVFISHAWKYQFLNVVDAILLQLDSNPLSGDVIIWFDLFSNNQHGLDVNPPPFGWWCHTFLNAIKNIGKRMFYWQTININ